MAHLKQLSDFFSAIEHDGRIGIVHIAVYSALLHFWKENGYPNPISAFSYEIMEVAKISGHTTYHRCIKQLNEYGYIRYLPSFKRNKASEIYLKTTADTG